MARRRLSETGYYHITTRGAGQIALFEDDADRLKYLELLRSARDATGASIIAWVLMTDHVHLVADFVDSPASVSEFMWQIDAPYTRYFNARTGRVGTLFQGRFWSKPIIYDEQLLATVHCVHMNPEAARLAPMREYPWSSYREYAGDAVSSPIVEPSAMIDLYGSFETFDGYVGSPGDVVRDPDGSPLDEKVHDQAVLAQAIRLAGVTTSSELRALARPQRDKVIHELSRHHIQGSRIARAMGIGRWTVSRVLQR